MSVFSGYCTSQGYSHQDPRNLHPAFRELAELTSGQAILLKDQWELEELNDLTGGVLEGTNVISVGSNMSGRKKRNTDGAVSNRYSIPVDESIEKMTISVTTTKRDTNGGNTYHQIIGSMSVSEQLRTYPSPDPALTLTYHQVTVLGLGEG